MKNEEFVSLLKENGIVDTQELFAKVNIVYSEAGQVISALVSNYNSQGVPGVIGINRDFLVLFEFSTFGQKPKNEVFRVPLNMVEFVSFKSGLFNISKMLKIKIDGRKYKIVAPGKFKAPLEMIASRIAQ